MILELSSLSKFYIAKNTCKLSTPLSTEWGDWVDLTPLLSTIQGNPGEILYIGTDGTVDTSSRLTFDGDTIFVSVESGDKKAFQVKNQNGGLGVVTLFVDENDHGGFSVEEDGGTNTGVKLRGDQEGHSFFQNKYVSIGRGGDSPSGGGLIDGAAFSVYNPIDSANMDAKNGSNISGDADDYLAVFNLREGTNGRYAAIGIANDNATVAGLTVGAAFVHEKLGGNSAGNLHIGFKTNTDQEGDLTTAMSFLYNSNNPINHSLLPFKFPSYTSTQIGNLTPATYIGCVVYNSTTNRFMGSDGSSWNNL